MYENTSKTQTHFFKSAVTPPPPQKKFPFFILEIFHRAYIKYEKQKLFLTSTFFEKIGGKRVYC